MVSLQSYFWPYVDGAANSPNLLAKWVGWCSFWILIVYLLGGLGTISGPIVYYAYATDTTITTALLSWR